MTLSTSAMREEVREKGKTEEFGENDETSPNLHSVSQDSSMSETEIAIALGERSASENSHSHGQGLHKSREHHLYPHKKLLDLHHHHGHALSDNMIEVDGSNSGVTTITTNTSTASSLSIDSINDSQSIESSSSPPQYPVLPGKSSLRTGGEGRGGKGPAGGKKGLDVNRSISVTFSDDVIGGDGVHDDIHQRALLLSGRPSPRFTDSMAEGIGEGGRYHQKGNKTSNHHHHLPPSVIPPSSLPNTTTSNSLSLSMSSYMLVGGGRGRQLLNGNHSPLSPYDFLPERFELPSCFTLCKTDSSEVLVGLQALSLCMMSYCHFNQIKQWMKCNPPELRLIMNSEEGGNGQDGTIRNTSSIDEQMLLNSMSTSTKDTNNKGGKRNPRKGNNKNKKNKNKRVNKIFDDMNWMYCSEYLVQQQQQQQQQDDEAERNGEEMKEAAEGEVALGEEVTKQSVEDRSSSTSGPVVGKNGLAMSSMSTSFFGAFTQSDKKSKSSNTTSASSPSKKKKLQRMKIERECLIIDRLWHKYIDITNRVIWEDSSSSPFVSSPLSAFSSLFSNLMCWSNSPSSQSRSRSRSRTGGGKKRSLKEDCDYECITGVINLKQSSNDKDNERVPFITFRCSSYSSDDALVQDMIEHISERGRSFSKSLSHAVSIKSMGDSEKSSSKPAGCVSKPFYEMFQDLRSLQVHQQRNCQDRRKGITLMKELLRLIRVHNTGVLITGYGLGSQLAQLCLYELLLDAPEIVTMFKEKVRLVTFATGKDSSSAVFDASIASYIDTLPLQCIRYVNDEEDISIPSVATSSTVNQDVAMSYTKENMQVQEKQEVSTTSCYHIGKTLFPFLPSRVSALHEHLNPLDIDVLPNKKENSYEYRQSRWMTIYQPTPSPSSSTPTTAAVASTVHSDHLVVVDEFESEEDNNSPSSKKNDDPINVANHDSEEKGKNKSRDEFYNFSLSSYLHKHGKHLHRNNGDILSTSTSSSCVERNKALRDRLPVNLRRDSQIYDLMSLTKYLSHFTHYEEGSRTRELAMIVDEIDYKIDMMIGIPRELLF